MKKTSSTVASCIAATLFAIMLVCFAQPAAAHTMKTANGVAWNSWDSPPDVMVSTTLVASINDHEWLAKTWAQPITDVAQVKSLVAPVNSNGVSTSTAGIVAYTPENLNADCTSSELAKNYFTSTIQNQTMGVPANNLSVATQIVAHFGFTSATLTKVFVTNYSITSIKNKETSEVPVSDNFVAMTVSNFAPFNVSAVKNNDPPSATNSNVSFTSITGVAAITTTQLQV